MKKDAILIKINGDLKKEFKVTCMQDGRSMSEVLRGFVKYFVENENDK